MQKLVNCDFIINIERIENISGAEGCFEITFSTADKKRCKFILNGVWDMRYSHENTNVERFYEFRKCLPDGIIYSGIYVVKNSEYVKYFECQTAGTRPIDELTHYIVSDREDTILDILIDRHIPILVPLK